MAYFNTFGPDGTVIRQEVPCDERLLNFAVIRNMFDDLGTDFNDPDSIQEFKACEMNLGWKDEPAHPKCFEFVYAICDFIKENDINPDNFQEKMGFNDALLTSHLDDLFEAYTGFDYDEPEKYKPFYHDILNLCNKYDADAQYEKSSIILEILCCHYAYIYFQR